MAEIYQNIRKKDKISFGGYSYRFDKLSGKDPALSFWRCDVDGCKAARIHMKAGDVVQERGEHLSHAPNLPKVEAAKAVHRMKVQAKIYFRFRPCVTDKSGTCTLIFGLAGSPADFLCHSQDVFL
ncbi:hypothetical protein BaRGS_00031261 [Batillaria attramentaria]|uniref:FLYWCH-type domain-containing protein n=1 Tax=Batillaria attramentaria TaxID=370345 RepID=A0ABD0J515_9CAEN